MPKRRSAAVPEMPSTKAARTGRSVAVSVSAATNQDAACQTDSAASSQENELLQMALLKIKAAFVPPKQHGARHGQSEEAFEELEARIVGLLKQMEQARELVDSVLRTPEIVHRTSRRSKLELLAELRKDVLECLDRDTLDTLQVTSSLFGDINSRNQAPVLRVIDTATFKHSNYPLPGQEYSDEPNSVAAASVKRASGREFVVEMDSMMGVYGRVIPYLRYTKCQRMELVIDDQQYVDHDGSVDPEKLVKLLAATQTTICVDSLRLEMGNVNANLVIGIISSMKAVRRLELSYGGDADAVNVDFFLSCSRQGITDIFIDANDIYNDFDDIDCLNAEGIVPFLLAGATDGKHRTVTFGPDGPGVFNLHQLLHLIVEETGKLHPCTRFTFDLFGLYRLNDGQFDKFRHGDALVIDDLRNGLIMEIRAKQDNTNFIVRSLRD